MFGDAGKEKIKKVTESKEHCFCVPYMFPLKPTVSVMGDFMHITRQVDIKLENQVGPENVLLLNSYLFVFVMGFMNGIQEVSGSIPLSSTTQTINQKLLYQLSLYSILLLSG